MGREEARAERARNQVRKVLKACSEAQEREKEERALLEERQKQRQAARDFVRPLMERLPKQPDLAQVRKMKKSPSVWGVRR